MLLTGRHGPGPATEAALGLKRIQVNVDEARIERIDRVGVRPAPRPGVPPQTKLWAVSEITEQLDEEFVEVAPEPEAEQALDSETLAIRDAALAHVRKFGDPILKTKARPVKEFDDALRAEIGRMAALMSDALGIGLAANQVGVLNRVLVYRVQEQAPVAALINPEIEWRSSTQEIAEDLIDLVRAYLK